MANPSLFNPEPEITYSADAELEKLLISDKDQGDFLADLQDDARALGLLEGEY